MLCHQQTRTPNLKELRGSNVVLSEMSTVALYENRYTYGFESVLSQVSLSYTERKYRRRRNCRRNEFCPNVLKDCWRLWVMSQTKHTRETSISRTFRTPYKFRRLITSRNRRTYVSRVCFVWLITHKRQKSFKSLDKTAFRLNICKLCWTKLHFGPVFALLLWQQPARYESQTL